MTKILALSGKKGAGKNTLCNFIHGYQLKSYGIIDEFDISDKGELIIHTSFRRENGKVEKQSGLIDITRLDIEFAVWAMDNIWPFIKQYAFATALKEMCIGLFDIPKELLYGSDEQKNTMIQYKWEDMPVKIKGKSGFITAREFLQYFGTDICRKIYSDVWTNRTIKDIQAEQPFLAVISDARFDNEVEAVKQAGGKVIRLTRSTANSDSHESENQLDSYNEFDYIIDNKNMSIEESCQKLIEVLDNWGWLDGQAVIPVEQQAKKQATMSIK